MNVIIANKYRDALSNLNIDVIKKLEGEFSVDEIISTFKDFFFQRMILDITALKGYKDIKTLQKLSLSLDMDRVILLLDGSPEVTSPEYLSDLISMRIYNFTMNVDGIMYLYNNPNSYRDVAQYHQLDTFHDATSPTQVVYQKGAQCVVIGLNDITEEAGATTLTYIMMRQLQRNYKVTALEVNRHDFMYFDDKNMHSVGENELGNNISKYSSSDVILVDLNNSRVAEQAVGDIIYLLEPSKIKLNKLLAKNPRVFDKFKNKKIVLNKSLLSSKDVLDFEYETNSKTFYSLPPLYDQENNNRSLDAFLAKMGFGLQMPAPGQSQESSEEGKGLFGLFK